MAVTLFVIGADFPARVSAAILLLRVPGNKEVGYI
jgi:hypothetical protein